MKKTFKSLICLANVFALTAGIVTAAAPEDFYSSDAAGVEGTVTVTPEENLFSVDGSSDEWIFLDSTDEGIFVLKNTGAGENIAFDSASSLKEPVIKFDLSKSTNIASIINSSSFIEDYIPRQIADNMIETEWNVAAGSTDGLSPEAYSVSCKVTLLSAAEYAKYFEKIGVDCGGAWFLRDPHPTARNAWVEVADASSGNKAAGKLYSVSSFNFNKRAVRPACMLDSGFFGDVKLNIDSMGENILSYIKDNYTKEDLSEVYDDDELAMIFDGVKTPKVENLVLTGENKTGYPIGYEYDFVHPEGLEEGDSIIKWYISDQPASASYTEISVDGEYYILPAHGGKYLTVEVTPVDEKGIKGKAVKSSPMGPLAASKGVLSNQQALFENQQALADPASLFKVAGWDNTFVLLDEDESGRYFIGTTDSYGNVAFDTGSNVKFDPQNSANVGYYLNNSVLKGENSGTRLPASVIEYIDTDTVWFTEAGNPESNAPHDYYTKAPIALMSYEEWKTYYNKFGFDNGYTATGWWLRSSMGTGDAKTDMLVVRTNASPDFQGRAFQYGSMVALMVRPVFWLERDFFKNVKLDVKSMGSEVKDMILKNYTMNDLSSGEAGYSREELEDIGFGNAPSADGLYVSGIAAVGNELEAAYTYSAELGEGESVYQWYISDSVDGVYSPIEGADGRYLNAADNMAGKFVKFSVIPKNSDGVGGLQALCRDAALIAQKQPLNFVKNEITDVSGQYPDISDNVILYKAVLKGEAAELSMITAVYGENNSLISVQSKDISFTGGEQTINETITRDSGDGADSIRIIILDKDGNRPLVFKEVK